MKKLFILAYTIMVPALSLVAAAAVVAPIASQSVPRGVLLESIELTETADGGKITLPAGTIVSSAGWPDFSHLEVPVLQSYQYNHLMIAPDAVLVSAMCIGLFNKTCVTFPAGTKLANFVGRLPNQDKAGKIEKALESELKAIWGKAPEASSDSIPVPGGVILKEVSLKNAKGKIRILSAGTIVTSAGWPNFLPLRVAVSDYKSLEIIECGTVLASDMHIGFVNGSKATLPAGSVIGGFTARVFEDSSAVFERVSEAVRTHDPLKFCWKI